MGLVINKQTNGSQHILPCFCRRLRPLIMDSLKPFPPTLPLYKLILAPPPQRAESLIFPHSAWFNSFPVVSYFIPPLSTLLATIIQESD